ncbi:MAG: hypothetical protein P8M30_17730 [Planctomycetaceae bacterium]|nr:hypothetical protein [Planctomycetaceae bacterium]MDG2391152.1 hypothetical protein [Planctomycetaceae bacterium]
MLEIVINNYDEYLVVVDSLALISKSCKDKRKQGKANEDELEAIPVLDTARTKLVQETKSENQSIDKKEFWFIPDIQVETERERMILISAITTYSNHIMTEVMDSNNKKTLKKTHVNAESLRQVLHRAIYDEEFEEDSVEFEQRSDESPEPLMRTLGRMTRKQFRGNIKINQTKIQPIDNDAEASEFLKDLGNTD